ncbi:hypothetical protein MKZ38_004434 [Zalerion maritima]|uniref:Probable vacuolar protein sorting-associated protein 16 homolog n=1 Tax=Zalerion maritima TaxID=339359 RepID=A0AAD5RWG7_9PEZI|nr:hypothetical protein MKZ38_004434 [Zalerion maritima]
MEAEHPTETWERVGDKFYRKVTQFTELFSQDIELDNYIISGAPYGGAVALYRDETKLQQFKAPMSKTPSVDIYSLAGNLLRQIPWDRGQIKGLGWSEDEKLLIITTDGSVRCYNDLQGDFTQFSLGNGADEYGVHSVQFYSHGFVALLENNAFVSLSSYDEPRPKLLPSVPEGDIHSWTIIPPAYTLSRGVEVLVSVGSTVYTIDATECEDRFLDIGPFSHLTVSPNGKYAALYTTTGHAHVITTDFQSRLSEHDSKSRIPPEYVLWCGNDAVVTSWEDEVNVIGPNGNVARYFYNNRVHLIPEHDGVRLLTIDSCDFLQRVPSSSSQVFAPGTPSPAAVLLDAIEQLEHESPKADDNIQRIRPSLVEAVDVCVSAAGQEPNVHWQKQLLKAASFGKSVLDIYNSDDFVDMCEILRVLNAVRFYKIGFPLSHDQYIRLTPERLIGRLLNRHEYLLALRVAGYLKLSNDRIYTHWAAAKVKYGTGDDDSVCLSIIDRLAGKPGISFEAIARAAYDEGRGRLATQLLNHEPRAGRQVPLLMNMEEDDLALDKAVESGDSDLVLSVLRSLRRKLPLSGFLRAVSARPLASALIEAQAAREGDAALLKDLYYQDDRRLDGARVFVSESLRQPTPRTASDKLALAGKVISDSKEASFELHAIKEAQGLLRMQEALTRDLTDEFVGLSVNETVYKLYRLGFGPRAKKTISEFKVGERTAAWLRLRALVAKRDWGELEEVGKARRSCIGWEPYYNALLQAGNPRLAATFVPKCASSVEQGQTIVMYEKCGLRVKAAEEAVRLKDAESWIRLLDAAGRQSVEGREIEDLGQGVFRSR